MTYSPGCPIPGAMLYLLCRISVTSSVMDQNSKLVRLFAVLKTIADVGPVATADHEFADAARQILERTMRAFEAEQAALLLLDGAGAKITCVASAGFPSLNPHAVLPFTGAQGQHWHQSRAPRVPVRSQDVQELFGSSPAPFLSSIKCIAPLRVSTGPVGALILGARHGNEA